MLRLNKILWLCIIWVSIPVFIYVWIDEGFLRGKAYMFIVSFLLGIWGYGAKELYIKLLKKKA